MLSSATAYSIETPMLTWQGHEVTSLSSTKSLPNTFLEFRLSPDFSTCFETSDTCGLVFRSEDLPIDGERLQVRECTENNQNITCTLGPFTFSTQDENVEFEYFAQVGTQRIDFTTSHIAILIDDTQPELTAVDTSYCDESCCYVPGGVETEIGFTIEDTQASFDYGLLFVGAGGSTAQVSYCNLPHCKAKITLNCQEGDRVTLRPISVGGISARDDAQNDVIGESQPLCCSTQPPEILSCESEADGVAGLAVSGGSVLYTAEVISYVGEPRGEINASAFSEGAELVEASCTRKEQGTNTFVCQWLIQALTPGTYDLRFDVFDAIGNNAVKEEQLTILDLKAPPPGEELDLLEIQKISAIPERLNRMAIDVAIANSKTYPFYITYDFTRKKDDVQILSQELTNCVYKAPGDDNFTIEHNLFALGRDLGNGRTSRVLHPDADWNETNRLNLEVIASRETLRLADTFTARCDVEVVVRDDEAVYIVPEVETIECPVSFRESALGDPGAAFVDKIEETQKKLNGSSAEKLRKLEKWRQKADEICRGVEKVVQIHNTAVALQGLGTTVCSTGWGASVGQAISGIGSIVFTVTDGFIEGAWNGMHPGGGRIANAINRVKQATNIGAYFGVIPENNALLESGGWLKKICRQVNCRVTADMQDSSQVVRNKDGTAVTDKEGNEVTESGGTKLSKERKAKRDAKRKENLDKLNAKEKARLERKAEKQGIQLLGSQGGQGDAAGSGAVPAGVNLGSDPTGPGSWENRGFKTDKDGNDILNKKGRPKVNKNNIAEYAGKEVMALANVADAEASLTGALFSMCLGGVIYNLQKQQALECTYLQCLKDQAFHGHSIHVCEQGRSYQMCLQTVGEAMELPFVRTVKNVMGNINGIIATAPSFLAKHWLNEGCAGYYGAAGAPERDGKCVDWGKVACLVSNSALNTLDNQRNSKQALGGIPHEKAEQALALCEQALQDIPAEALIQQRPNAVDIERRMVERQLDRASVQSDSSKDITALYQAWDLAYPGVRRPTHWHLERDSDGAVTYVSPRGTTLPENFVPPRVETKDGRQHLVFEYDKDSGRKGSGIVRNLLAGGKDAYTQRSGNIINRFKEQFNINTRVTQGEQLLERVQEREELLERAAGEAEPEKLTAAKGKKLIRIPLDTFSVPDEYKDAEDPLKTLLADEVMLLHHDAPNRGEASRRYMYTSLYNSLALEAPSSEALMKIIGEYEKEYNDIIERLDKKQGGIATSEEALQQMQQEMQELRRKGRSIYDQAAATMHDDPDAQLVEVVGADGKKTYKWQYNTRDVAAARAADKEAEQQRRISLWQQFLQLQSRLEDHPFTSTVVHRAPDGRTVSLQDPPVVVRDILHEYSDAELQQVFDAQWEGQQAAITAPVALEYSGSVTYGGSADYGNSGGGQQEHSVDFTIPFTTSSTDEEIRNSAINLEEYPISQEKINSIVAAAIATRDEARASLASVQSAARAPPATAAQPLQEQRTFSVEEVRNLKPLLAALRASHERRIAGEVDRESILLQREIERKEIMSADEAAIAQIIATRQQQYGQESALRADAVRRAQAYDDAVATKKTLLSENTRAIGELDAKDAAVLDQINRMQRKAHDIEGTHGDHQALQTLKAGIDALLSTHLSDTYDTYIRENQVEDTFRVGDIGASIRVLYDAGFMTQNDVDVFLAAKEGILREIPWYDENYITSTSLLATNARLLEDLQRTIDRGRPEIPGRTSSDTATRIQEEITGRERLLEEQQTEFRETADAASELLKADASISDVEYIVLNEYVTSLRAGTAVNPEEIQQFLLNAPADIREAIAAVEQQRAQLTANEQATEREIAAARAELGAVEQGPRDFSAEDLIGADLARAQTAQQQGLQNLERAYSEAQQHLSAYSGADREFMDNYLQILKRGDSTNTLTLAQSQRFYSLLQQVPEEVRLKFTNAEGAAMDYEEATRDYELYSEQYHIVQAGADTGIEGLAARITELQEEHDAIEADKQLLLAELNNPTTEHTDALVAELKEKYGLGLFVVTLEQAIEAIEFKKEQKFIELQAPMHDLQEQFDELSADDYVLEKQRQQYMTEVQSIKTELYQFFGKDIQDITQDDLRDLQREGLDQKSYFGVTYLYDKAERQLAEIEAMRKAARSCQGGFFNPTCQSLGKQAQNMEGLEKDLKETQALLLRIPGMTAYTETKALYEEYVKLKSRQAATTTPLEDATGAVAERLDILDCQQECAALIKAIESEYPEFEKFLKEDEALIRTIALRDWRDREKLRQEKLEAANKFAEAIVVISDYVLKEFIDEGKLDFLSLAHYAEDYPEIGKALEWSDEHLNPEGFKQSFCNDKEFDIRDNDDGAVYQVGQFNEVNVVATFASEYRKLDNWSHEEFFYLTVAYVTNPSNQDYQMDIVFTDLQECVSTCPEEFSLTNDVSFDLASGASFSSGNFAKTRLDYLPGRYGQLCLRFDHPFPDGRGTTEHCREIREDTINTGSPVPPKEREPQHTKAPVPTTGDPEEGWS